MQRGGESREIAKKEEMRMQLHRNDKKVSRKRKWAICKNMEKFNIMMKNGSYIEFLEVMILDGGLFNKW